MTWFFELIGLICGVAMLLFFFVGPVGAYFFTRYERKKEERDDSTCRQDSEPSDDFMEEREDVIRIIAERLAYFGIIPLFFLAFIASEKVSTHRAHEEK